MTDEVLDLANGISSWRIVRRRPFTGEERIAAARGDTIFGVATVNEAAAEILRRLEESPSCS